MIKPEYWESQEAQEQYADWLKCQPPAPESEPKSRLTLAVAKARGDILTDEDMYSSIRFLNRAANFVKHGKVIQ